MKSIIQAYSPEEIKRIARGEQTIKVCKTAPKDTPFKVYMYCTKDGYMYRCRLDENRLAIPEVWNGKVVGEYVCDKVDNIVPSASRYMINNDIAYTNKVAKGSCLYFNDLEKYLGNKVGRALHITAVKFYDEPKKLTDFNKPCVDKYQYCQGCMYGSIILSADEEEYALYHGGRYDYFETACHYYVSRPPRGWQYVEEL